MSKVSVKSVIEAGLEKGNSVKVILGQIEKKCPDSKADESHIRFYANKMVRENKMDEAVAADKYGCGKRGRKPSSSVTPNSKPAKVKAAKSDEIKPAKVKAAKSDEIKPAKVKAAKSDEIKPAKVKAVKAVKAVKVEEVDKSVKKLKKSARVKRNNVTSKGKNTSES